MLTERRMFSVLRSFQLNEMSYYLDTEITLVTHIMILHVEMCMHLIPIRLDRTNQMMETFLRFWVHEQK